MVFVFVRNLENYLPAACAKEKNYLSFQASAAMLMRSVLFWDVMQHLLELLDP
jgi:hypothetical protein